MRCSGQRGACIRRALSEATRLYRQILETDPKHFDALLMLGVALLESGQREEANVIADGM
jgi:hypothetical protein